jgi:hypothetical protein
MLVRRSRPESVGERVPSALAAVALLAAAALPSAARAQQGLLGPQGPQALVSMGAAYDTNVAQTGALVARQRGLILEDGVLSPSVQLDLTRPVSRQALFLTGSLAYELYQRNRVLNRERIDLNGGGRFRLGRCDATGSLGYGRHRSSLQQLAVAALEHNTEIDTTYRVQADCARGLGLSPSFSYSERTLDNTLALQKGANSRLSTATAGLKYERPSLGSIELFGEYDRNVYPVAPRPGIPVSLGYTAASGGLRYTRQIGARLQADVQFSERTTQQSGPSGVRSAGLAYQGDLTYRVSPRLVASANFANTTSPANQVGVSFSRTQSVHGDLRYMLSSRLSVSAGAGRQDQVYEGGQGINPALFVSHTRIDSADGAVELEVGKRLRLVLNCRWQQSIVNISSLDYSDVRVGLTASAKF